MPWPRPDPGFAKTIWFFLLGGWSSPPNAHWPASEFVLSTSNPPVHAWACWQVFERTGGTDHVFLERAFHKLLMNFTWWVNRKDPEGRNVFSGGFLGMDNRGVFYRSRPLPSGCKHYTCEGTDSVGL